MNKAVKKPEAKNIEEKIGKEEVKNHRGKTTKRKEAAKEVDNDERKDEGKPNKLPKSQPGEDDKKDDDQEEEKPKPKRRSRTSKKDNGEKSAPATWGGRWIPTEEPNLSRFRAIQVTFNELISPRVRCQSSLQSPFFKLCNGAFKTLNANATYDDHIACAQLQVEKFLGDDAVSIFFRIYDCYCFENVGFPSKKL